MNPIGYIEEHIFGVVLILAVVYIGVDLFRSRKEISEENVKKGFEGFLNGIRTATFKECVLAFFFFMMVFFLFRGMTIAQNEMQECEVWLNTGMIEASKIVGIGNPGFESQDIKYKVERPEVDALIKVYIDAGFGTIEQNRSYNYYNQWFNARGGRAEFVNINCNFKISLRRFIKNIKLDYLKGVNDE